MWQYAQHVITPEFQTSNAGSATLHGTVVALQLIMYKLPRMLIQGQFSACAYAAATLQFAVQALLLSEQALDTVAALPCFSLHIQCWNCVFLVMFDH
jgi:hypothetical protein